MENIPPDVLKILLTLALASILGLERETRKIIGKHYYFGGVVTFPLIGLMGYGAAVLSSQSLIPLGVGLGVLGAFLFISYRHKITTSEYSGFTNEIAGVIVYLQSALVYFEHYWVAATLVVLTLLFLELKNKLEALTIKMPSDEIFTLIRFLFLTAVILPIVPNQEFTTFQLNPYKIWLVVVAVSSLSYLSYLLQRFLKERGGVLLAAFIGGTYSSTAVTVTLSKQARTSNRPHLYSGSILVACGVMCLRIIILLALFNLNLMNQVLLPLMILALVTSLAGYLWSKIPDAGRDPSTSETHLKNPLELLTAFLFALIFLLILIATQLMVNYFGVGGIYYLAALVGGIDVDPFVMGLTQTAGTTLPYHAAAIAVLIAVSGNNFIKGLYALLFGRGKAGVQTAVGLLLVTLIGLTLITLI